MQITSVILFSLLGFLLGAALAATVTFSVTRRRHQQALQQQAAQAATAQALAISQAQVDANAGHIEMRQAHAAATAEAEQLQNLNQQLRAEIKQLHAQQETDNRLLAQLTPLTKNLDSLQKTVSSLETQRAKEHGEMLTQLRQTQQAEQKLLGTATSLAHALSNTNSRGSWGESTLRRIVEAAGMTQHIDFNEQVQLNNGQGAKLRPDMLVHLPQGKHLVIDAKAPLAGVAADTGDEPATESSAGRQKLAKALRAHIDTLSSKEYAAALPGSAELVLAFIPAESILTTALEADPTLLDYAFEKGIALVAPVSLWATLRAVAHSWRQSQLSEEAQTVLEQSKKLYDRFGTFAGHLEKLGNSLGSSVKHFNSAIGSIERNVLPVARRLAASDPHAMKLTSRLEISEQTEALRHISAPELLEDSEGD